ncbi:hypothetical protein ACFY4C_37310 [Actinomadura viridis]|uniref:hypothetical protein n=1 Tax=Actinomadura viridis TaxID=58110 RepID=UPI00369A34F7
MVLGAAVLVATGGEDSAGGTGPAPPGTVAAGECRPSNTRQQIPTAAPADVTWQVFNAFVLPVSASAGPMVFEGELARCYAHTPTGALVAAAQIGFRYSVVSDWRALAARQLVDGSGKAAFLAKRSASPMPRVPERGKVGQLAGFQFVTYDPATAVVQLVVRNHLENNFMVSALTVKWRGGDWQLELQPNGVGNTDPQVLATMDGYIAWGGV